MKKSLGIILSVVMLSQSFAFAQNDRVTEALAQTIEERANKMADIQAEIQKTYEDIDTLEAQIDKAVEANRGLKNAITIKRGGLAVVAFGVLGITLASRKIRAGAARGVSPSAYDLSTSASYSFLTFIASITTGVGYVAEIRLDDGQVQQLRKELRKARYELAKLTVELTQIQYEK